MDIEDIVKNLEKNGYKDIFIWEDKAGTYYNWHAHPYEEIRVMLKGSMKISTPDGSVLLKRGDILKVKAGEKHNAEILEDSTYICGSKM